MSRVIVSFKAKADIGEIVTRIGLDKPDAAMNWLDRLNELFEVIRDWPGAGPARDELRPGLRSLPHGNYLIFYRINDDGIDIVRVLDGRRNLHSRLFA